MKYFIFKYDSRFPILLFNNLVENVDFVPDNLTLVYHGEGNEHVRENLEKNLPGFSFVSLGQLEQTDFQNAERITFLSISHHNNHIITKVIEYLGIEAAKRKIHVWITDDEVHRLYRKYGFDSHKFREVAKEYGGEEWAFSIVDYYSNFYLPWGQTLERIVGRSLKFDNELPIIPVLSPQAHQRISASVDSRKNRGVTKVLFGSKNTSGFFFKYAVRKILLYSLLNKGKRKKPVIFGLWSKNKLKFRVRFFLPLKLIKLINSAKNTKRLGIELQVRRSPEDYLRHINTFDFMVAQERGGGSTIRDFIKCGGQVVFLEDSPNHLVYKKNYDSNIPACKSLSEGLAKFLDEPPEENSYTEVKNLLEKKEKKSLLYYKRFFG